MAPAPQTGDTVANSELEHTDGGQTTRSDATDVGVPMAPAEDPAAERVGPEDALGDEPTRGDYSNRLAGGPSLRSKPVPAGERQETVKGKVKIGDGKAESVEVREPGPNVTMEQQAPAPATSEVDESSGGTEAGGSE